MPPRQKTTTQKGLGWAHQQQRTRLLRRHIDGAPCWWCGRPMFRDADRNFDGKPLAADHSHARAHGGTVADRMLHSKCNSDRQDGSRDHERPAVTGEPFAPAVEDDRARWCLLDW
ncbi:hypothetical protein [Rhodococcus sp. A5(2022)]|uniref:hypothetical protein n=1 Tax=Rhodococcus sp. A5(2022) TaxID=3003588 RepID=UPI0022A8AD7D|nr:hypothetical protein [Rhodococcus sp. A5(2022)]MCZ1075076.1 hypothetical protein [Rhodococcus sp. A5(2022)]